MINPSMSFYRRCKIYKSCLNCWNCDCIDSLLLPITCRVFQCFITPEWAKGCNDYIPRSHNYIPFKTGRPKRDKPIDHDDIINLKISLNQINTFDKFLKEV